MCFRVGVARLCIYTLGALQLDTVGSFFLISFSHSLSLLLSRVSVFIICAFSTTSIHIVKKKKKERWAIRRESSFQVSVMVLVLFSLSGLRGTVPGDPPDGARKSLQKAKENRTSYASYALVNE